MALEYQDLVDSQTKAPPQYGEQGQVITLDQLAPATPITVPTPDYSTTTSSANTAVAGVEAGQKTLGDYISSLTPPETQLDRTQNDILSNMAALTGQNTGREQYKVQQENQYGLPNYQRQLADVNSQIQTGLAEYNKMVTDAEAAKASLPTAGVTSGVYFGQQAQIDRQTASQRASRAAELNMLNARAAGLSGQIQTAIQLADRAVTLKYAPIEDELKIRQAQLNAIQPLLNKQEKQQALAQQTLLQDRQNEIETQKEREKQVNQVMVQAAQFGADARTLDAISKSGSVGEAIRNAGDFLSAEFKQKVEQQKFENQVQLQQLAISRANLAVSQGNLALSQRKQQMEEARIAGLLDGSGQPSQELMAYASQYAATGKIPTGIPEGTFGLIAEIAKSAPKEKGTLVDKNTGVKSEVSDTRQEAIAALHDIVTNKLPQLKAAYQKIGKDPLAKLGSMIYTTQARQEFRTLRQETLSLLLKARSGQAVPDTEYARYVALVPDELSLTGSTNKIDSLSGSLIDTLDSQLSITGTSIFGYSKVKLPDGKNYTVGDIIQPYTGQPLPEKPKQYRINPDGSLLEL